MLKEIFVFAGKTLFFSASRKRVCRTTFVFCPHSVRICSARRNPAQLFRAFSLCLPPSGVPFRKTRRKGKGPVRCHAVPRCPHAFRFPRTAVRRRPRSGVKTSKLRRARIAYFRPPCLFSGNTRFSRLGIDNLTICQSPSEGSSGISGKSEGRHPPRANT